MARKNLRTLSVQYAKRYLYRSNTPRSVIDYKNFPSTRYQGSKRKIIPWFHEVFSKLEFQTALDACGGTGSVSYLFKKMGKSVTYNDVLKFNHIIGKALIENSHVKFLDEDLERLLAFEPSPDFRFIEQNFKGVYYKPSENKWLDKTMNGIVNMNHYHGQTLDFKKAVSLYSLFQACLIKRPFNLFHRKNLYIRTADVERNFGNKTTWEKSFLSHFKNFIEEANDLVFDSGVPCHSINQSVFDIENPQYDLVYIDSPYFGENSSNETSNYLRCYHFLEGLSEYTSWGEKIDYNSINLRYKAAASNQFDSTNLQKTFDTLFEKFSDSIIVLSYKIGGTPSIPQLVKALKRHKANVRTESQHYKYALNKQNGNAKYNREVLIIGQ